MANETDTTTGAGDNASQTDMETITLNNRQITVSKEAAAILKDAESNLMSGYQAKLAKEREQTKQLLDEDTAWYSTHPLESWPSYDPKVHGGKGFTGDESQLNAMKNPVTASATNINPAVSFGDDMRQKQLERKIEDLEKTVVSLQESDMKRSSNQVAKERDDLLRKYPFADSEAVTETLRLFYVVNQRHPSTFEVETIIKKKNDYVALKVANAQQGMIPKQTATPSMRGTSPLTPKEKLPALDDVDGWVKLAHDDLAVR